MFPLCFGSCCCKQGLELNTVVAERERVDAGPEHINVLQAATGETAETSEPLAFRADDDAAGKTTASAMLVPVPWERKKTAEVRISAVVEVEIEEGSETKRGGSGEDVYSLPSAALTRSVPFGGFLSKRTQTFTSFGGGASPPDASCRTNMSKYAAEGDRSVSVLGDRFDPQGGLRATVEVRTQATDWTKNYVIEEELGRGGFGVVLQVQRRSDGQRFALKVVDTGRLNDERFEREFAVSRRLRHPNIVGLRELYRGGHGELQLVMDLCTGGDLFQKVVSTVINRENLRLGGLSSREVGIYLWQMLSAVAYLHHYRFTHRDIKLENFMLESKREDAQLKLIDFGLARQFAKGTPMHSRVGTPSYCAPEVWSSEAGGYDERVDIWSLGVCAFLMGCSSFPFRGENSTELFRHALNEKVDYSDNNWGKHPKALLELIERMLAKSPYDRPAATQVLADPWLSGLNAAKRCCVIS